MLNTIKKYVLLIVLAVFSVGCSSNRTVEKRNDVTFLLNTGSTITSISRNVPAVAGANIIKNAYTANSTKEFLVDTSFETAGVGLLVSGLAVPGSGVLAAHSAYDAYEAKSIRKFQWSHIIQIAGFATGNPITGVCVGMLVSTLQTINNHEYELQQQIARQKKHNQFIQQINREQSYLLAVNKGRQYFWQENEEYIVVNFNYK